MIASALPGWFAGEARLARRKLGERSADIHELLGREIAEARFDLVWTVADNLNAMMAVPNLIALLGLHGIVVRESRDYVARVITNDASSATE